MDQKVYRVQPITWMIPILFSLLIAFLIGDCVFLTIQTINTRDVTAVLPLLSAICLTLSFAYVALLFFDIPMSRIELSAEGVLCYSIGYRLYAPWHTISSIIWTTRPSRFPRFFKLKEPALTTLSVAEGRSSKQAIFERHWWVPAWLLRPEMLSARLPVPVRFLSQQEKKDGMMNAYLQRYAPHLEETV